MVPAGLRDQSTTTAVTRRIALPAAVTGVTADTWNVTGYVASGVASRRKAAVAPRAVQAGNRKLERAAVTDVAGVVRPCGISDPLFGFKNPLAHGSKIRRKVTRRTREKSNK
ncbi:hypothetical protein ALC57_06559 [Trachymyrmex cornetzi]|uniref:Uncharacterized protein n=1 Tax=Trachymyrmex cornetzi TaxID=471704 RepID=A0A151J883_9HYME|nr:hypothetical protein ALC57_06559 [Trachymyrmex cornetzi]